MYKLFNDAQIINMKQPFRSIVSRMICMARVSNVKKNYAFLGGCSPIFKWTEQQGKKTIERLSEKYPNLQPRFGYSYASPNISDAIGELAGQGFEKIVVVPLYPYYSIATLGSMYSDIEKARQKYQLGERIKIAPPYFDHDLYHDGTIRLLLKALAKVDKNKPYRVIFTAHSLPESSVIKKGDPYRQQVERSYRRIVKEVVMADVTLAFQSKIGPIDWMRPSTIEAVGKAGRDGLKQIVVMPLGFTCDHIETLHELDVELAEIAHEGGIETFIRGEVFNDADDFILVLANCIDEALS